MNSTACTYILEGEIIKVGTLYNDRKSAVIRSTSKYNIMEYKVLTKIKERLKKSRIGNAKHAL